MQTAPGRRSSTRSSSSAVRVPGAITSRSHRAGSRTRWSISRATRSSASWAGQPKIGIGGSAAAGASAAGSGSARGRPSAAAPIRPSPMSSTISRITCSAYCSSSSVMSPLTRLRLMAPSAGSSIVS